MRAVQGWMAAAIAAMSLVAAPQIALGQTWKPVSPIRMIVPWPPGGATDVLARFLAPGLTEKLGQSVLVENRPGASGSIGSTAVFEAKPDGTTLLVGVIDNTMYPLVKQGVRYDPAKFVPVATTGTGPYVLIGRPDLPASNLQELLALARKQQLTFANAGMGGSAHVFTTAFGRDVKIDNMLHVPYQGMAPALQALLGNQTDLVLIISGGAIQYQGRLKFYGVASKERLAAAPNIPTLTEQGIPFVAEAWTGILAPPGTPAPIVAALAAAINEQTALTPYRTKVTEIGMTLQPQSQPEFAKGYMDDYNKWAGVIRAANIKID